MANMISSNKITNSQLIVKGYLWVNLPVIAIILIVWFSLSKVLFFSKMISIFTGGASGWIYWEFSIKKWIRWALNNNIDQGRILKIGRLSLLLSSKSTIEKVIANDKK
jgi:hypothetical protein